MAESNYSFTQEQLKETKYMVFEESKQRYSKITKSKTFEHMLDDNACKYLLNESLTVQNVPLTAGDNSESYTAMR